MDLVQRPYQPGDEAGINKLYKLITSRDRSQVQYEWEWIKTWAGRGSIWLAFDGERPEGDQLVMQYSLIPVPISVWGESYLAGKTENCMAHPVCRGTGVYYAHEKKFFEEAKKKFQIFFTTASGVSKGAVGAVRRKLGYKAFDSWVSLFFVVNSSSLKDHALDAITTKGGPAYGLEQIRSVLQRWIKYLFGCYCLFFMPGKINADIEINDETQAPLVEIESLWQKNKEIYGITIERSFLYLDWRINQNPYFQHKYLIYRENGKLKGYAIFYLFKEFAIRIVDIFGDGKDKEIFKKMINYMILYSKKNNIKEISCKTSAGNRFLHRMFYSCGFVSLFHIHRLAGLIRRENLSQKRPFHVFISDKVLKQHPHAYRASDWYMTELIFEGRVN